MNIYLFIETAVTSLKK